MQFGSRRPVANAAGPRVKQNGAQERARLQLRTRQSREPFVFTTERRGRMSGAPDGAAEPFVFSSERRGRMSGPPDGAAEPFVFSTERRGPRAGWPLTARRGHCSGGTGARTGSCAPASRRYCGENGGVCPERSSIIAGPKMSPMRVSKHPAPRKVCDCMVRGSKLVA